MAFDFDGIIADDSAETVYQQKGGLASFFDHEILNAAQPLPAGPLQRFFREISKLQKIDIPFEKGGSSTYRNMRLMNRSCD